MDPLFPWEDDDPEVQEVCEEYRRAGIPLSYSNGQFRGWRDRLGRPNPRMRVPDTELARIAQRVMELKMESAQEEAEAELERARAELERVRVRAEALKMIHLLFQQKQQELSYNMHLQRMQLT